MILKKISKEDFDKYFALLESDFCLEERKTKADELTAFNHPNFSPNFIFEEDKLIGYACFWNFENFLFVEHFAILNTMRGTGCGSKFLKEFSEKTTKPIVLEVELPETEVAAKRIRFYERVGYVINEFKYYQPSYHKDTNLIPMHLMSFGSKLSKEDFDNFTAKIKNIVYNQ